MKLKIQVLPSFCFVYDGFLILIGFIFLSFCVLRAVLPSEAPQCIDEKSLITFITKIIRRQLVCARFVLIHGLGSIKTYPGK
jgi:hypothetical protein